jgi:hypothetical protein
MAATPRAPLIDADSLNLLGVGLAAVAVGVVSFAVILLPPAATVGIVAGVVAATFFFARPAWSILLIFAGRVVIDLLWSVGGAVGGLNLLELYGGGVAALAAAYFFIELRRVERQAGFTPLMVYFVVLVLAAVRSLNVRDAAEILAKYISPLLLMFLVASLVNTDQLRRRFLQLITAAGLVSLSLSVYHLATGQRFKFFLQGYYRLHGGYNNLHNHALFLLFLNALVFFWVMNVKSRAWRFVLLGVQAAALTGFSVFVVIYLLMERRYNLLLGALGAGVLLLLTNTSLQDRFYDVVVLLADDEGVDKRTVGSGRFGIWTSSFAQYLRSAPLDLVLGRGLGGHYELTDVYADLYRSAKKSEDLDPHNDYLSLLFQLGPIALVSYLSMQVLAARQGLELHRRAKDPFVAGFGRFIVALTAVTSVTNFLSNSFIQRVTVAWLFWGMVGVVYSMRRELPDEAPPPRGAPPLRVV